MRFHYANTTCGGGPAGMRLGDCTTQRNLDFVGLDQAQQSGNATDTAGVAVKAALPSEWCRTMKTAELTIPSRVVAEFVLNSFADSRAARAD